MRLIDADKLKNGETLCKVFENLTDEFYGMLQLIDEQPTVDVVEVVRCKNCKHRADVDEPNICGDGEREEGEQK